MHELAEVLGGEAVGAAQAMVRDLAVAALLPEPVLAHAGLLGHLFDGVVGEVHGGGLGSDQLELAAAVLAAAIGRLVERDRQSGAGQGPCWGRVVADHARVWLAGPRSPTTLTSQAAARLRKTSQDSETGRRACGGEDLTRNLADYDRALRLVSDDGQVS